MDAMLRAARHRAALLTTDQMNQADRLTIEAGASGLALMEQAGRALADHAAADRAPGNVIILAGPGNNGGDGFAAARHLQAAGWRVRVGLVGESHQLRGDAATMASQWQGARRRAAPDIVEGADLLVDAIYGAGLNRDVDGEAGAVIAAVNAASVPVVSADIASGVDGNSGAVRGIAIQADETVTFFRPKPGHCLMPGRALCGRLRVVDIGIPDAVLDRIRPGHFANGPALWAPVFPLLDAMAHKGTRGHCMVVSGGPLNTGAGRLAAGAALRAGAGLVTVLSGPDAARVNAGHLTAVMVAAFEGLDDLVRLVRNRAQALVIGPAAGVTATTRNNVLALLALKLPLVLDADALSVFEDTPDVLFSALHEDVVLTPHWGEFRRLFPDLVSQDVTADRPAMARAAAARAGACVLLKGPDTVIAQPDDADYAEGAGPLAITTNAPPDLATAGSGDVLTGLIAGLMAQGMPAFEAACAGAWLHGEAGRQVGRGLIAEDLAPALPAVLQRLSPETGPSRLPGVPN